ncbi:hypothetical protein EDF32_0103 [Cellulomonas sp. PhB143]|nr:hypothetical protein EDF32_0103 [Cellulomonas sp. PhB143]
MSEAWARLGRMDRDAAREVKAQLAEYASELYATRGEEIAAQTAGLRATPRLAIGLAPVGPDDEETFEIAVRYEVPEVRGIAESLVAQLGPGADLRETGPVRALSLEAGGGTPEDASAPDGGFGPRPPVASAQALGETGRVRPLRPGVSIANVAVTAGTLGAFVELVAPGSAPAGARYALSNYHVLVGGPGGAVGDVVVQPGPADGGAAPQDAVGTLASFVELVAGRTATVDCALALLDDPDVDPTYPAGRITTTASPVGGESVAKIGRTTGTTAGRVTAIELDDVAVGYGEGLGVLRFDDQIEVEPTGQTPFSQGGDSGSLVYRADGVALGLLFAGSERGGQNGHGLTYVNPIDAVLGALGARLLGA